MTPAPGMERVASTTRPRIWNPTPLPSQSRPPSGLSHRFQPLLTWEPQAGRGWGARAPGEGDRRDQGKPPAWRARGVPPPGRIQQAEAQEQGPATRAGLGERRGLGAAAWGWTWAIYERQGPKKRGAEMSGSAPTRDPAPSPGCPRPCSKPRPPRPRTASEPKPRPPAAPPAPQPKLMASPAPRQAPPSSKLRPSLQVGAPETRARHCPVPALLPRAPGWGALGPWGPALVPASGRYALHLQPGVVHGRGHGRADGGRVDVADNAERLLQCVVHAQHLVAPLSLLGRFFHECVLVPARVQVGQQLGEDKLLGL